MLPHPDQKIRCLLIQPEFAAFSFWNYKLACELIDAKTPSPPLGLITVAAILPQHWEFRLLDLNTRPFSQEDWDWAQLLCVGGMLPQQRGILALIAKARQQGKFIAVGGADPSSQPDIYSHADVLVVGEGESAIPLWLESWKNGQPSGVFKEKEKPDVSTSPCPRYDLLNIGDYAQIGVQYSRGCPFNCEFCDIIELYGRKPRTKTPTQILKELSLIKSLGYSGSIDIVDDNFIGNKRNVKRHLLPAMIEWNESNGYPFFYATEASMNLADDDSLLQLLQKAEFRIVFIGIETPDPDLLLMTQKSQNTVRPIVERVKKIYEYGIVVTAGFIMGFDGEKAGMDKSMIKLIDDLSISMAMVGLLVALPNTQLTRRLLREKRLLSFKGEPVESIEALKKSADSNNSSVDIVDQTAAGLNFVTTRSRFAIFSEYQNVIANIYSGEQYFERIDKLTEQLQCKSKHRPRLFELWRNLKGFARATKLLAKDRKVRFLYMRSALKAARRGPVVFEQMMRLISMYLHFREQSKFLLKTLTKQTDKQQVTMPKELHQVQQVSFPKIEKLGA